MRLTPRLNGPLWPPLQASGWIAGPVEPVVRRRLFLRAFFGLLFFSHCSNHFACSFGDLKIPKSDSIDWSVSIVNQTDLSSIECTSIVCPSAPFNDDRSSSNPSVLDTSLPLFIAARTEQTRATSAMRSGLVLKYRYSPCLLILSRQSKTSGSLCLDSRSCLNRSSIT